MSSIIGYLIVITHSREKSWSPFIDGYQGCNTISARGSTLYWAVIKDFDIWQRNVLFYLVSFSFLYKREAMEDNK